MASIYPVIMAGGSGTRLWPLSRQSYPKQFLAIDGGEISLLQQTIQRMDDLTEKAPCVICSELHRFIAAEQLRQIGLEDLPILLEPIARNTAPAIALAALHVIAETKNADSLLLVLAADHVIGNKEEFHRAVRMAVPFAESGSLVTFGVVPTRAETGYGYIERAMEAVGSTEEYKVRSFKEKPDQRTAEEYVSSGRYLWNSGMFMFKAASILEELRLYHPDIVDKCSKSFQNSKRDGTFLRADYASFNLCPEISIDHAVMERTDHAVVIPMDANWSDVGSWASVWEVSRKDKDGNVIKGDGKARNSSNTLVHAESRLVIALGVESLMVIETPDAVLVASMDAAQEVKSIPSDLEREGRTEHYSHRNVYRPWGMYDCIDKGDRYQVKRITVQPGAKLSVQMHHHRAEHWIVVSGTAKVVNGDKTYLVTENQSTFIPIGQIHSLENPGVIPLELIEVQSGSYLGEDDIVRLKDVYGRI